MAANYTGSPRSGTTTVAQPPFPSTQGTRYEHILAGSNPFDTPSTPQKAVQSRDTVGNVEPVLGVSVYLIDEKDIYEIRDSRFTGQEMYYLVVWRDYTKGKSWESGSKLVKCGRHITRYHKEDPFALPV